VIRPTDAIDVLCGKLMHDLFVIPKFLFLLERVVYKGMKKYDFDQYLTLSWKLYMIWPMEDKCTI